MNPEYVPGQKRGTGQVKAYSHGKTTPLVDLTPKTHTFGKSEDPEETQQAKHNNGKGREQKRRRRKLDVSYEHDHKVEGVPGSNQPPNSSTVMHKQGTLINSKYFWGEWGTAFE